MTLLATLVEAEVIATVDDWVSRVADLLTSEVGRSRLREGLRQKIRTGAIPTMQVIAAARAGNRVADEVLREMATEMLDRGEMPGAALRAYTQEVLQESVTFRRGRNVADTWVRDCGIAILVELAIAHWHPHLPATRNRASKRRPSACSIVAAALGRHGHNIGERRIEKIYASHDHVAEKLSALIPPI